MKDIDYELVTKYLIKFYEIYPKIYMDFASLDGKIVVHKFRFENDKIIGGQSASWDYSDFENITKKIRSGEFNYDK